MESLKTNEAEIRGIIVHIACPISGNAKGEDRANEIRALALWGGSR